MWRNEKMAIMYPYIRKVEVVHKRHEPGLEHGYVHKPFCEAQFECPPH